jgi:hypothetical protein
MNCAARGAFDMQPMYCGETDLHRVVQEHVGLTNDVSNEKALHDAPFNGMRSLPSFEEPPQRFPQVGNIRFVDPEVIYSEDKLGCARGVMWAVAFEAAVIITVAICWELRFFLR